MTKALLIFSEYAVWLLPAIFVFAAMFGQAEKIGDTTGIGFVSTGVVLASVAVTFKISFVLFFPKMLLLDFAAGDLLIFIAYVVLLNGIYGLPGKRPVISKSKIFYIALFVLFVLYALFEKKPFIALDIFAYALLVFSVILGTGEIFSEFYGNNRNLSYSVFVALLLLDFVLKGFTEILRLSPAHIIELSSFIIRIIASVAILYAIVKISAKEESEEQTEILFAVKRFLKKVVVIVVMFSISLGIFSFTSVYVFKYTLMEDLRSYSQIIEVDAADTANSLQYLFANIRKELGGLATNPDVVRLSEKGKEILRKYYENRSNEIASVTRMNKKGVIAYTYPFTNSIGKNISNQPHVKLILKTHTPVLSNPIMSVQGFPAIAFHVPVFKGDLFDGSVAALVDLERIGRFVKKTAKNEKILIADDKGTIIYAPERYMLLKNIYTVFQPDKSDTFVDCRFGSGLLVKKTFNPVSVKMFSVYAFVPKRDVFHNIFSRLVLLLLLGGVFVASLIAALKILYDAFQSESSYLYRLVETKSRKAKTLSSKLSHLISLFAEIDPNFTIEEASEKILRAFLKIIENGKAGSILVKNGNRFVFTAVSGYPESLKGKFLTEKEIVPSVSDNPFIIRHIYDVMKETARQEFEESTRNILEVSGSKNIKCTLEAPLIVNGEYYGGIFIDNFRTEDAFDEEDLRVAEAMSKLASLIIETKLLLNSQKEIREKLFFVVEKFSELDIAMDEETFFSSVLAMGRQLVPQADAGSATLRNGDFYEYKAIFGYKGILKKLKLRVETAFSTNEKEAQIVKNLAKFNEEHLTEEEKEIFKEAGAWNLKQSLTAPIIAEGKYIGGIFLDSFKEGDVFTENDIKAATALSKLSSMFVEAKISYQKLKAAVEFNNASLNLFHRAKANSQREDVLKYAFNALKHLYGKELQEIAIWEKTRSSARLIKFDGKNVYSLSISPDSVVSANERRKSCFVESEDRFHKLAQAMIYTGIERMPVFRIRFGKEHIFSEEEKFFIERFGREVVNLYRAITYQEQFKEILANYVLSIGNATSAYDSYTEWHSMRVGYLSLAIGEKMRLSKEQISLLLFSAILHDVGKIGIPREILQKPGKLTEAEFEIIKRHPVEGEKIVKPINPEAAKIIRHHHEHWDGSGYPDRLKGEEIPLLSRIITVADVFDALITDRTYRKAFDQEKAIRIMKEGSGKLFDPNILSIFLMLDREILSRKELFGEDIDKIRRIIAESY